MLVGRTNRRAFIAGLGSAAAWPAVGLPQQQPSIPVVGYLSSASHAESKSQIAGFQQGLGEIGFADGRNVGIEFRWSEGDYSRLPPFAAGFVSRPVAAILAGGLPAALAVKRATTDLPIVFIVGADPVAFGLVTSLNRPNGNLTGVSQFYGPIGAKRLELLHDLVPATKVVGIFSNPINPNSKEHLRDIELAAATVGLQLEVQRASSEAEISAGFAGLLQRGVQAILVADDPFFNVMRQRFVELAAQHAVPAIYYSREFVEAGGLIAYGTSTRDSYRAGGAYVGKILSGTRPADLPVLQPTKFELLINLKTARALGLTPPPSLLARADEVIE